MLEARCRLVGVRGEQVRVVAQRADPDARFGNDGLDARDIELRDIDVGDPGVAALGLAGGPAHDLDAVVTLLGRELEDLPQAKLRENGAGES